MKKFIAGFIVGIFTFLLSADVIKIITEDTNKESLLRIRYYYYYPSIGLYNPLTKRCTKDIRKYSNNQRREYFECNKIQIIISDVLFGEYEIH